MTERPTAAVPLPTLPTVPPLPDGLDTPALVVWVDRMRANVERLQSELDIRGTALRPHVKTHKSVRIARIQLDAGARGITVGTIGEAETFVAAGIGDVFIAYPIWASGSKAARIAALHEATPELRIGVDSAAGADALGAAVAGSARRLRVLIELDSGHHRTGVAGGEAALEVARAARDAGLDVEGVFTHGGHGYRPGGRERAATDEVETLGEAAAALEAGGFDVRIRSAGSTPTMVLAAATGRVDEIRAGTYALGDRQQLSLGAIEPEGIACAVAATVVSATEDRLVIDAGAKALTKDRADHLAGFGLLPDYPDLLVERLSDYHGVAVVPPGAPRPVLGQVVAVVPNHICPVVDLRDSFVAVLGDGATEMWPVDARGRSG